MKRTNKIKKKLAKKISKKTKAKKQKISSETKLSKIIEINPNAGEILFESGMHCIGCGMASGETLEDGCKAHGMNKKQIDELIKKLNEGR